MPTSGYSVPQPVMEVAQTVQKSLDDYRGEFGGTSNIVRTCDAAEMSFARNVLDQELRRGEVEFFCGSGVGRAITGVDWVGLVNLGASAVLSSKNSSVEPLVEKRLAESADFQLLQTCFQAYKDGRAEQDTPEHTAVLERFGGSFFEMVKQYAKAVDACLVVRSQEGYDCPCTYNVFIANFMAGCYTKETCPGPLAKSIAQGIVRQLGHPRMYGVYTTNYSRCINFALLQQGVTVEEIYPVRYRWKDHERDSSAYGDDMHIVCSVLTPSQEPSGKTVRIFHLHGIAKAKEEFLEPESPGPHGRSSGPLWARQSHRSLGKVCDLMFSSGSRPASLLRPWGSASDANVYQDFPDGESINPTDQQALFEATAEGIVITDAHYACVQHAESLKGCFQLAMDDTGRTMAIFGSSLSDEFFSRFLNDNLDANVDDQFVDCPAQGITVQVCAEPRRTLLEGDDVLPALKPYLLFVSCVTEDGTPDFAVAPTLLTP